MVGRPKKYQNPDEAKKVQKEKIKLWRLKNKERLKAKVKEYQKKNPEIVRKSHLKYYKKNKDLVLSRIKKYRKNNPEKIKKFNLQFRSKTKTQTIKQKKAPIYIICSNCKKKVVLKNHNQKYCSDYCRGKAKRTRLEDFYKEYYKKYNKGRDPKKTAEYNKRYRLKFGEEHRKKNSEYRKKNRKKFIEYNNKYKKTQKGQINTLWDTLRKRIKAYTFSKTQTSRKDMDKMIGCSRIFLHKYIESQFYDHPITNKKMSWKNSNEWHIDHITPLAVLDPKNDEHLKIANYFCNLQPMWADENLKKGPRITPGYGVAHLKRKYKTLQSLGDLTKISNETEAKAIIKQVWNKD